MKNRNTILLFIYIQLFFRLLICLQFIECLTSHQVQRYNVEDRHQTDSDISQIPYKCISRNSSNEQHHKCQYFVCSLPAPFVTKQICHITSCIKENSQKCRKTERWKRRNGSVTDCDEISSGRIRSDIHCSDLIPVQFFYISGNSLLCKM